MTSPHDTRPVPYLLFRACMDLGTSSNGRLAGTPDFHHPLFHKTRQVKPLQFSGSGSMESTKVTVKDWGIRSTFTTPNAPEHRFSNIDKGTVIIGETPDKIMWAVLKRDNPTTSRETTLDAKPERMLKFRLAATRRMLRCNQRTIESRYGTITNARKRYEENDSDASALMEERDALRKTIDVIWLEMERLGAEGVA